MAEPNEAITPIRRAGAGWSWRQLALCAGHPDRGCWFPDDDGDPTKAVAICRVCPVQVECLEFAVATGQTDGIWGGTSPSERRRMARQARHA